MNVAKKDDPAEVGFRTLFVEHAPFVWRLLRRLGVSAADADDASQDVFMVVHRKLATFEGRSSMRTWIGGIAVRTASQYRRRHRVPADLPPPQEVSSPEGEYAQREALSRLGRLLDALSSDQRAVLVLYEIEEFEMKEVAATVGCPLQTAYSRLHSARRKIQELARREERREGFVIPLDVARMADSPSTPEILRDALLRGRGEQPSPSSLNRMLEGLAQRTIAAPSLARAAAVKWVAASALVLGLGGTIAVIASRTAPASRQPGSAGASAPGHRPLEESFGSAMFPATSTRAPGVRLPLQPLAPRPSVKARAKP